MGNRKKRKHKRKYAPPCVYCGLEPGVTNDHVIPQSLFPKPKPPDSSMVLVPVCNRCNNTLSKHQAYLRDVLIADVRAARNLPAHQLFNGEFARSIETNWSELARDAANAIKHGSWLPLKTLSGIYVGQASVAVASIEYERLEILLRNMVRGLYYKLHGEPLPGNTVFEVCELLPDEVPRYWQALQHIGVTGPLYIGRPDVCQVAVTNAYPEDPTVALWWFAFYESVVFLVKTEPPNARALYGKAVRLAVG